VNREARNAVAQPMPQNAIKPTSPRPEILEIPVEQLVPERRDLPGRMMRAKLNRVAVPSAALLPSFAAEGDLTPISTYNTVSKVSLKAGRPQFDSPSMDLKELEMPDDLTQVAAPPKEATVQSAIPDIRTVKENRTNTFPLDKLVRIAVTIQRDPSGTGGCYQVDITPAEGSDAMGEISKDVLFILDRSNSITPAKYSHFKRAVQEALPALSPHDRFNVISFNDKTHPVFKDFAEATSGNIDIAVNQVGKLAHGGRTDVFKGLAPFVKLGQGSQGRPLNIFILTDGRSTVNIYKPNIFLRQIVEMNPGNVSVFPFSAGENTNRQLLDFLGYLNRGDKFHVKELSQVRDAMVRFFARYNYMIVNDLTCDAVSGANANEVFPKSLANLYRGQALRLLGRFDDSNRELVLRLTGRDANGRLCDLVFRRRLLECPAGDAHLRQRWAAQKVLYLLARRNSSDNPAEIANLNRLIGQISRAYNIYSGY